MASFCQADWMPADPAVAACADQWAKWYMQLRPLGPEFWQTLCGLTSMSCQMEASQGTAPVANGGSDNTMLLVAGGVIAVGALAYFLTRS